MYPRVLITLFSQSCPLGGALMAFDLETGAWNSHWFHSPMLANFPHAAPEYRGRMVAGLTGMCRYQDLLLAAQYSQVLCLRLSTGFPVETVEVVDILRHPLFSDLHDVRREGDRVLVVSPGTETVVELQPGQPNGVGRTWDVLRRRTGASRVDPSLGAYDKYTSTKPHPLHINMAVLRGDDGYVTACMPGEILRLRADGPAEAVITGLKMPHDGEFVNGGRHFAVTSAQSLDAHLFEVDGDRFTEVSRVRVPANRSGRGWLRGLMPLSESRFLVGLSVWRDDPVNEKARVFEVDFARGAVVREWRLPEVVAPLNPAALKSGVAFRLMNALWTRTAGRLIRPNIYKIIPFEPEHTA